MKNVLTLIIAMVGFINYNYATIRTVSNNLYSPGQYTNLQTAIDASSAGDTVYVQPSPIVYAGSGSSNFVSVKNRICLFGGGYDGRTYQYGLTTQLLGITFDSIAAQGSYFCGFSVPNIRENLVIVANITFERCYMNSGVINANSAQGWVVRNCILVNAILTSLFNATISNNIISGTGQTYVFNSSINNNIFYNIYIASPNNVIRATNSVLNNNIFIFDSIETGIYPGFNCTNSVFNNNISYSSGNVSVVLPPVGNTGANNLSNTDPQFVSTRLSVGIDSLAMPALAGYNWHLKTSSAGHNTGADGSDMGIYGGTFPMPNLDGVPPLPQVRRMDILNPQVPFNGSLNVHVIGTTRN
jgi:hypothetical protein